MHVALVMKNRIVPFLVLVLASCGSGKKHVGIQVLGDFDRTALDSIHHAIDRIYGFEVSMLPEQGLPEYAFTTVKTPRYRADKIIRHLKETRPDSIDFVLGLLQRDISTTKRDANGEVKHPKYKYEDWGIFGLGYKPGSSSVVSSYRVRQSNPSLLIERLQKICIHELGHNLGLAHCPNVDCVMRDAAESIRTIDGVELNLCQDCWNDIH